MALDDVREPSDPRGAAPEVRRATDAAAEPARLRLDTLLTELMDRAGEVLQTQGRLRALLDAVVSVAEDLSLAAVLHRITSAACELVEARYGALGVVSADHRSLTDFITVGMTDAEIASIGSLPKGLGILGLVIDEAGSISLDDLSQHPKAAGFPPGHPPMSSFLGVPIRIRSQVYGNLYLTEKKDGQQFSEEDEQLVVALAAAAGVAIQNAQLFDTQERRQLWLTASSEIRRATLAATHPAQFAELIVRETWQASGGAFAALIAPDTSGELVVQAASAPSVVGIRVTDGDTAIGRVVADRSAAVVAAADLGTPESWMSEQLTGSSGQFVIAPLGVDRADQPLGVLVVGYPLTTTSISEESHYVAGFAGQVGVVLLLAQSQQDRERLVVLEDRDRIARDLHDLVIQRLFATGMTLQSTMPLIEDPTTTQRLTGVIDDLDATIRDVRQAIYQLQAQDSDADLRTELQKVVDETSASSSTNVRLRLVGLVAAAVPDRLWGPLLAVVREALSNAVRHSRASCIDVTVEVADALNVTVADDGAGLDPAVTRRSGLANLAARAAEFGGSMDIGEGERGAGTRLVWTVPLDE